MPLVSAQDVRSFGRLPDEKFLSSVHMQPHLDSAAREIARWIGDYSTATGDKLESCKEAEMCLCIAYLLPVLNTQYSAPSMYAQSEIGESGFLFDSPSEKKTIIDGWIERARMAISTWTETGGTKKKMGWYAV